jgi:AcrR family transcriptional regulator
MKLKISNIEPERRDAIINAGLEEFAQNGYKNASTNVIAEKAGISKALLFHYVSSKSDLFLYLFNQCETVLQAEYYSLIDTAERDLLQRLRQAYLLKASVIRMHPWVFDFIQTALLTTEDSIRKLIKGRLKVLEAAGYETIFGNIDESLFREELNVSRCRLLIYWAVTGFSQQTFENAVDEDFSALDFERIRLEFDGYLAELRAAFYQESNL